MQGNLRFPAIKVLCVKNNIKIKNQIIYIMDSENITITEEQVQGEGQIQEQVQDQVQEQPTVDETTTVSQPEVRLVDVEVTDDNVALNLMVSYLNIAQRRGVFNLDESAKIWECVQRFIVQRPGQQ